MEQNNINDVAPNMPVPLATKYPYLREKATGVVHPWHERFAERSDLFEGCYNLAGSTNPADTEEVVAPAKKETTSGDFSGDGKVDMADVMYELQQLRSRNEALEAKITILTSELEDTKVEADAAIAEAVSTLVPAAAVVSASIDTEVPTDAVQTPKTTRTTRSTKTAKSNEATGTTPAVDTPAVDTPAVDTPAVDTPAVDTPAVDTPAVDTPAVDTPVATGTIDGTLDALLDTGV